jgi:hypothetical protein
MPSRTLLKSFRISRIVSGGSTRSAPPGQPNEVRWTAGLTTRPRTLRPMRNPSLGVSSFCRENLHPRQHEKSVAESVYLLQQAAYDCSLASPSGNQLSRVPISHCPINGILRVKGQFAK